MSDYGIFGQFTSPIIGMGLFLVTQMGAIIWWASDTNSKVESNHAAIVKITENAKDIAVIKNDIGSIKSYMKENEESIDGVKTLMNQILYEYESLKPPNNTRGR